MDAPTSLGLASFLAQSDGVSRAILIMLLGMSLATWYLIVVKTIQSWLMRRRSARFLERFWNAPSLQAVQTDLEERHQQPDEPFSHLTYHAMRAVRHHQQFGANKLNEAGSSSEFLTRSMRRILDEDTARVESGLTVLASIGSVAPFVGLFGTVWGIYHALIGIGMSGAGTLDKVAGPVGEALIMTALGLAVAIPAVLAYNVSVRANRVLLARLDSFAHDLFAFLSTGSHFNDVDGRAPILRTVPAAKAG